MRALIFLLVLLNARVVQAQERLPLREAPHARSWLTPLWFPEADGVLLAVGWRIPYSELPFLRGPDGRYRVELEFLCRLYPASSQEVRPGRVRGGQVPFRSPDIEGSPPQARRVSSEQGPVLWEGSWRQQVIASTYEETRDPRRFVVGVRPLKRMPEGRYRLEVRWTDPLTERGGQLGAFFRVRARESSPLWAEPEEGSWRLHLLGEGEVAFARPLRLLWILKDEAPESLQVGLYRLGRGDSAGLLLGRYPASVQAGYWEVDSTARIGLRPSDAGLWAVEADLRGEELELNGAYRVELRWWHAASGRWEVRSWPLRTYWTDMPAVLYDAELSVEVLRYIASEEEWRAIRRARSPEERWERFMAFWRQRDPTPETAYNELMVEFYRRVQEAQERFSTPRTAGWRSDRGRIYITYGPPARIERRYPPGRPTEEVWYYDSGPQFVFVATSSVGDFVLRR
jgi:GWxTD domain-containing protein|nr:MAG: hypothetical protein KatS3mg041_1986 [Bacteroidota bacterium]